MWTLVLSAAFDIVAYIFILPFVVSLIFAPVTMAVLIASLVALYLHARRLCETCARSMPLDCASLAQKRKIHLHLMHILDGNKKAYWGAVVVLVVAMFFVHGMLALALSVFFKLAGVEIIYGSVTHKKLQPWCPWCGERGIHVKAPTPTRNPVGSGV
jgi:hypothetical protein